MNKTQRYGQVAPPSTFNKRASLLVPNATTSRDQKQVLSKQFDIVDLEVEDMDDTP